MFLKSKYNATTIFTLLYLMSSLIGLFYFDWTWKIVAFALFNYIWFGLSSSLYYHRVLTHGSLKLSFGTELFFLIGGLIGLGGDPIKWSVIHRYHHQHSDEEVDSHSPKHGLWWSYYGWVTKHDPVIIDSLRPLAPDLTSLSHLNMWINPALEGLPHAIYSLGTLYFLGWDYLFLGLLFPALLSYNAHWMLIASLCHLPFMGEQPYKVGDNSRNVWWLSLFSFGESMHNNHHRYPKHVNLNSEWYVIDLTSLTARLLEKLGLATEVRYANYKDDKK